LTKIVCDRIFVHYTIVSVKSISIREFQENNYPTQRRKGAKFKTLLSVFAPLRENLLGFFEVLCGNVGQTASLSSAN